MSAYTILKFVHVVLAIVAVGANITYGIWLSRAGREPGHLAFALRGIKVLDDRFANPAYLLLLITGLAMVHFGKLPFTTPWLLVSLILYIVMVGVGFLGYTPLLRKQIAVLEATGPTSSEFQALSARGQRLGIMLAVLVIAIVFLMTAKPALWT